MQIWLMCIFAVAILETVEIPPIAQFERISVVGLLALGCWVLWKTLTKKDEQLIENSKAMAQALITSSENSRRLAETTEKLSDSIDRLQANVGVLPCMMKEK